MNLLNASRIMLLAATSDATPDAGLSGILMTVVPLLLMVVVFYFLLIRPEKKRSKQAKAMLDNLQIADEVVTSGGIIGRVLSINAKENTVLIETGSDRTRIRVLRSCISENRTIHDAEA